MSEARDADRTPPSDPSDERWKLVERILASPTFRKSPRLSSFLTFIVTRALQGKGAQINEQQIGIYVFGRQPSYSPGDDSIVRSQARFLRQRLEEYFESDGRAEKLRILIPKGSYVPFFQPVKEAARESSTVSTPASQPEPATSLIARPAIVTDALSVSASSPAPPQVAGETKPRRRWYFVLAGSALAAILMLLCFDIAIRTRTPERDHSSAHRLWASLFEGGRAPIIVPSDSTLVLFGDLTNTSVKLSTYLDRNATSHIALPYGPGPLTAESIFAHQYTSMADLALATRIARLPEAAKTAPEIRYARDLRISDLKESNVILIGGARTNPWIELFTNQITFYVDFDHATKTNLVLNRSPQKGEQISYAESNNDPQHRAYGVVAWLRGLDPAHQALLIEGTSMAGTECASDFITDDDLFRPFARKIETKDGTLPHFEVLLETKSLGGNAPFPRVIGYRILSQ